MLLEWVLVMWLRVCAATVEHLHPPPGLSNFDLTTMGGFSKSKSSLLSVLISKPTLHPQAPSLLQRIATVNRWPKKISSKIRRKREIDDGSYNNYNGLSYENSQFNNNNNNHNRETSIRNDNNNFNNNNYDSNNNQNAFSGSNNSSNNNHSNGHQNEAPQLTTTAMPSITASPSTNAASGVADDSESASEEVLWGALCSPRFVLVLRHHDVFLRCEVWAPLGTIIRWRKDSQTLRTDLYHNEGLENSVDGNTGLSAPRDYGASRQNAHSFFFLDCASRAHRGTFEMMVLSPSGRTYSRFFSVFIVEDESRERGLMCRLFPHERRLLPRIHAYRRVVSAPLGTSLTLPCHYRGDRMQVTWTFDNQRTDLNWTVNGDLLIPSMAPSHQGIYMCTLQSTFLPQHEQFRDRIITSVQPCSVD